MPLQDASVDAYAIARDAITTTTALVDFAVAVVFLLHCGHANTQSKRVLDQSLQIYIHMHACTQAAGQGLLRSGGAAAAAVHIHAWKKLYSTKGSMHSTTMHAPSAPPTVSSGMGTM